MADNKVKYYIRIDDKHVASDMKNAEGKVASSSGKIASAVKGVGLALGGALVAAGGAALTFGSQFETAMAKASTLIDTNVVDMAKLESSVLALSDKTGVAAADLGNTMYNALSAGVQMGENGADMMAFLEKNAQLAKAGFTDVDTAVTSTAKVMNAYKMSVEDTDKIHKILMQTQNKGITTVGELGASLAQVTPTAAAMSVGFEQVGAALATMTAQGTPTAQATTQLNSLFAELGKQGTNAQKALEQAAQGTQYAGMSFQDMMAAGVPLNEVLGMMSLSADMSEQSLIDMFGSLEAGKAALAMTGANSQQFTDNLVAMSTEADVVGEAFSKVSDTAAEKFGKILNQLKNAAIELFGALSPVIDAALPALSALVTSLAPAVNSLAEGALTPLVECVARFLPQLGELIGSLLPGAVDLFTALLAPLETIAAIALPILIDLFGFLSEVIGAFAEILPEMLAPLESSQDVFGTLSDSVLPALLEAFSALNEPLREMMETVLPALADVWTNVLVPVFTMLMESVLPALTELFVGLLVPLMQLCEEVLPPLVDLLESALVPAFTLLVEEILPVLTEVLVALMEPLMELVEAVLPPLLEVLDAILTPLMELVEAILPPLLELFESLVPIITGIIDVLTPLLEIFLGLVELVLSVVMPAITMLAGILTGVLSGALASVISIVGNVLSVFGNFIDFIKNVFTGNWQAAWENIRNIFKSIADGFAAIFKGPINAIIDLINGFLGGLNSIHFPSWLPVIGGMSFDVPLIPRLKKGMDFVPGDFFPAYLDYGERVLTKEENTAFGALGGLRGMEQALSLPATVNAPSGENSSVINAMQNAVQSIAGMLSQQSAQNTRPIELHVTGEVDGQVLFDLQKRISLERGYEVTGGAFDYDRK